MELSVFCNFIIFGCRAPLLTLAPLSYVSYMSCMMPYKQVTASRMSRACRALLTSGSTIVPGANYFVKYVLRVLQHLCTPCNACVTSSRSENCLCMSKSRQLRPERDTAMAYRGPSENCVYMCKSQQLRPERACSAGAVWWLCSCPQGRIACSARSQCPPAPVQAFYFVAQHYVPCCLCTPVITSYPTPTSRSATPCRATTSRRTRMRRWFFK